jgi:predicted nucleic acid-binding protein
MFVLDTNVVSHLRRPEKADPNVVAWAATVPVASFFISSITLLELELGTLLMERKDTRQGSVLRAWIDAQVLPRFAGRILAVDTAVALRCARLHVPDPCADRDALIAATALVHGMTVVTRNVEDFQPTGVEILNPWEWEPGQVTLHMEMQEVLRDKGNRWMTPAEIAAAVNRRDLYHRRDKTQVPDSQIAARARKYEQMFECRTGNSRLQIRLRHGETP